MKSTKIIAVLIFSLFAISTFQSCKSLKQLQNTFTNIQRCEFRVDKVDNFSLSGISLGSKRKLSDFSLSDGLNLSRSFASNSFPAEFVINVEAKNPNNGSGGSKRSSATMTSFDWQLYIDDVPTVKGNIDRPITIPGTGQSTIIPLRISMDLYEFFGKRGYDKVINLALALGGVNKSAAKIKLDARPTISTSIGNISYPGRITIVEKTWN